MQQLVDSPDRFRKLIYINSVESVKCVRGDFSIECNHLKCTSVFLFQQSLVVCFESLK